MEKILKRLSSIWLKFDDSRDGFFERVVLKTPTSRIFFIQVLMTIFFISIAIVASFDSFLNRLLFVLGFSIIGFISLIITASFLEKEKLKKLRLYPFLYRKLNFNIINYDLLQLNESEKIDFNLLLNRRRVQNKVNFKEMNKSKESASHPKLFSMFHVILEDGISDFKDTRLKIFFEMLQDSFLMNGKDVNFGTLKTSYTNWKGELTSQKVKDYNQYYRDIFRIEK